MQIVKAEILWTRDCHLKCHYCNMADGRRNTLPLEDWKRGIDNLHALGCQFMAFYGAEPLCDFDKLPETIRYAESRGINTTVITSGVVLAFEDKLKKLYDYSLRSLTMSHDIVPLDKASKTKSSAAMRGIDYFKSLGKIRDVAIVVTLTKKNYMYLTSTVEEMSMNGIWTFFDMIHADRGQPGTKCKGYDKELMFEDREDFDGLRRMLDDLVEMKEQGYMCHASYKFIAMLVRMDFHLLKNYSWNCAREDEFPSWVTVDCDGVVYPCDDFQPMFPSVMIMDLKENWDAFGRFWKEGVDDRCPGCCWNTHIDAHLIKRGELKIGEYVHGKI